MKSLATVLMTAALLGLLCSIAATQDAGPSTTEKLRPDLPLEKPVPEDAEEEEPPDEETPPETPPGEQVPPEEPPGEEEPPANPPPEFFEEVVEFGRRHDVIIASDEAYSEIYFDGPPRSILEFARDGVVAFFSLSKRSAMTCYRVGWVAGDRRIVEIFKKVKTNIDSGTPAFIQDAAIAALSDETHVEAMRREYREKRDIMVEAFVAVGLPDCTPEATLYIWQKVPDGMTSEEFTRLLLREDMAIVCTPGPWISNPAPDGSNPGKGHVRFALVPGHEAVREAARRIQSLRL